MKDSADCKNRLRKDDIEIVYDEFLRGFKDTGKPVRSKGTKYNLKNEDLIKDLHKQPNILETQGISKSRKPERKLIDCLKRWR